MTDSPQIVDIRELYHYIHSETGEIIHTGWALPKQIDVANQYLSRHLLPYKWITITDPDIIAQHPRPRYPPIRFDKPI